MEPWQFILIFILPGIALFAVAVCYCMRPPEWDDDGNTQSPKPSSKDSGGGNSSPS